MKVLIVHAHENPDSFCSAMARKTCEVFESQGHEVLFSDLYAMDFDPVGSKRDFMHLSEKPYYKYAMEQLHASKVNGFEVSLKREMDKLVEADIVNFNFPLWWYSMPAMLKGWVDRVMAFGIAYGGDFGIGPTGRFRGRRAFLSITTGSPKSEEKESMEGLSTSQILRVIQEGIFEFVGYEALDPFIAYGVSRISQEAREQILQDFEKYLQEVI